MGIGKGRNPWHVNSESAAVENAIVTQQLVYFVIEILSNANHCSRKHHSWNGKRCQVRAVECHDALQQFGEVTNCGDGVGRVLPKPLGHLEGPWFGEYPGESV